MIIAIVPAVTEPDIDRTLRSLLDQTRSPDRIIVAVNNAPDDTTLSSASRVRDPRIEVVDFGQITGEKVVDAPQVRVTAKGLDAIRDRFSKEAAA